MGETRIELPKEFNLYDVKDYYYWYVIQGKIPEDVFWEKEISFVKGLVMNDIVYEEWLSYMMAKERKKHG